MTSAKRALIIGVSGQDGSYLARSLCDAGYDVHGTSRDREMAGLQNLRAVGVVDRVTLHSLVLTDFRSVLNVLAAVAPDEIYNLAAQSSVDLSFETPVETFDSIVVGTLNVLESMRFLKSSARFYNAASSESFGDTHGRPATEDTPFSPRSPYGVAKAGAYWVVRNYREAYGLFACSGILFNHESPLRPARFVTQKVVRAAVDISMGRTEGLRLGNLDIARDWGWAPEYVVAVRRMLGRDEPDDFVIATGAAVKLETFVSRAFERLDLDWRQHVVTDAALRRPLDLTYSVGDPSKAAELLGWTAQVRMPELVDRLVDAERDRRASGSN